MTTCCPAAEHPRDLAPQRSVQVPVDLRRLGEFARARRRRGTRRGSGSGSPRRPLRPGAAAAWCTISSSRRRRAARSSSLRDRRLSAARRRGKDDRKRIHSRFSTCSRIRSSSSLIRITSCSIAASFALLPVVLASRSSSCSRKPSRLPTPSGGGDASVERNAAKCEWNRLISSDDVEPVGENGDLLREPLLVDAPRPRSSSLNGAAQPIALLDQAAPARARRSDPPPARCSPTAPRGTSASRAPSADAHLRRAHATARSTIATSSAGGARRSRRPATAMTSGSRSTAPTSTCRPRPKRSCSLRICSTYAREPLLVDARRRRIRAARRARTA